MLILLVLFDEVCLLVFVLASEMLFEVFTF